MVDGWLLMMVLLAGLGFFAFWLGARLFSFRWGLRWAICAVLGGLGVYNYLAFGLPGGAGWLAKYGFVGMGGAVAAGMLAGIVVGWLWRRVSAAKMQSG